MSVAWLVVGLGNPGERYRFTRHNAGARAAERLAADLRLTLRPPKGRLRPGKPPAAVAEAPGPDRRVIVARPSTFMNESGRAVAALTRWFKVTPENLIVIHDDIDLSEASLRIKLGGGSGGNRGVESVTRSLGTQDFYRIRIGVGRPPSQDQSPADFVLEPMSKQAAVQLADAEEKAAQAALVLMDEGLELTMTRFNSR